jgi:hypothetical protein
MGADAEMGGAQSEERMRKPRRVKGSAGLRWKALTKDLTTEIVRVSCNECQAEWAEEIRTMWEIDRLTRSNPGPDALPATDREWFEYLDQVAPVVACQDCVLSWPEYCGKHKTILSTDSHSTFIQGTNSHATS